MAYTYARAGQIITADLLNDIGIVGQVVFRAFRDTAQSIPSTASANAAVANAFIWETVALDDLGGWSVSAPTRYTVQRDGWYELAGSVGWASGTTVSLRGSIWFVNGAGANAGHGQRVMVAVDGSPTTSTATINARTLTLELDVGDYIEFAAGQSTGANLSTTTGGPRPFMTIKYVRPSG